MPLTCSVPNCKGNYRNGPKVSVFRFPEDQGLRNSWIRNIHRENFQPNEYSRVCELHFQPSDVEWETSAFDEKSGRVITCKLKNPRLKHNAVPTVMPNCPSYMSASSTSNRENPDDRRKRIEQDSLREALEQSVLDNDKYNEARNFTTLEELNSKLSLMEISDFWTVVHKEKSIVFIHIDYNPAPVISHSIVVNDQLDVNVYIGQTVIKKLSMGNMPQKVNNVNMLSSIVNETASFVKEQADSTELKQIISFIQSLLDTIKKSADDLENSLWFLSEQLSLVTCNKHSLRYSAQMMVFSSLLYTMAPHAYRFIRSTGYIILPHPCTVKNICLSMNTSPQAEQVESNFLRYIKSKYDFLGENDKTVSLMIDEIHIKPYYDYKGGNIAGMAFNCEQAATTAYVFMIGSILSPYKEVVHILPVRTIQADILNTFIKKVIIGLEDVGFFLICVVSDNNSINRKAMALFAKPTKLSIVYPHPADPTRPLFFVIDTVHILKCYRNNWTNQRNYGKCMFFPPFPESEEIDNEGDICTASFAALKKLHEVEQNLLLKYGYNLSLKALSPSNLEKQNVKLVLKIFNDNVCDGLTRLGEKYEIPHFNDTAEFIKIIHRWWSIVNVKTPITGNRLNDTYKTPLTLSTSDVKYSFLSKFIDWLDAWEKMGLTNGTLTKETHGAAKMSTHALLELTSYCCNELKFDYILPGKFQTDNLEARFSLYRQLAGSQYHVSMRQIYECENKLRIQSIMKIGLKSNRFGDLSVMREEVHENWKELDSIRLGELFPFTVQVTSDDIREVSESLPVITYLGGYCAHTVLKHNKCVSCRNYLTIDKEIEVDESYSLIKNLDKGKLQYPHESVVNAVLYNYIVIQKLCNELEGEFLKLPNQKHVSTAITLKLLEDEEMLGTFDICDEGHASEDVFKMIIWSSVNTLLNNYCKKLNDLLSQPAQSKKRKLDTFAKPAPKKVKK